jgi:uncharacterized protein YdhG (YjbR/CyaY superfamily)
MSMSSGKRDSTVDGHSPGFTDAEKEAMRERARELKAEVKWRKNKAAGTTDVLKKIEEMKEPDRTIAKRLHELIKGSAPDLSPRTWYGFPAYANKEGDVVCFYQPAEKFGTRYGVLGFSDEANLDEDGMWPTAYAITELSPAVEAKITALVKRAVSGS